MSRRSGKERKARRRARRAAEAEGGGGEAGDEPFRRAEAELAARAGAHWASAGGGRALQQDNAVVAQSLRWDTVATADDLKGKEPDRLTAKEIALLVTRRNMLAVQPGASNRAVANLIQMEAQNQRDDLGEIEPPIDRSAEIRRDLESLRRLAGELNAHDAIIDAAYRVAAATEDTAQPRTNGHLH